MEPEIIGVFIPIVLIVAIAYAVINLRKLENQERMSMIDKGINPSDMTIKRPHNTSWSLRFGLLLIGAGLGLLFGYFLDYAFDMEEVAYFSMLFIFGGAGLGISYLIEEKKNAE